MTKGLLNSINTKDRLYKILVQTDINNILYETMRLNLKTYQRILKNSIKEAIINQCLRTGVFPHQLKLSKVRPIFKFN